MDENPHVPLEPYPCNKIVYRAALFPDWIKESKPRGNQISKQAFFRLEKDENGVTVTPTPETCTDGLTDETYGIISLKVGWIRNAGFDVVPDRENHANIVGLPIRTEETKVESTGLAGRIAKIARPYTPEEPFDPRNSN